METPIPVPDDPDDAALIDQINTAVELAGPDESTDAVVAAGRRTVRTVSEK